MQTFGFGRTQPGVNQVAVCTVTYLQRDDNDEDFLLPFRQDVLDKGPAGANQQDGHKQEGTFHSVKAYHTLSQFYYRYHIIFPCTPTPTIKLYTNIVLHEGFTCICDIVLRLQ